MRIWFKNLQIQLITTSAIYIYIYIYIKFCSIISSATWLVGKFHRFEVKKRGEGRSSNFQSWLSIKKKKNSKSWMTFCTKIGPCHHLQC